MFREIHGLVFLFRLQIYQYILHENRAIQIIQASDVPFNASINFNLHKNAET